jgi:uncharacterized protein YqgC (DUF456 family)
MEAILIILGATFITFGLIGAFLPIIPGLPFSYAGFLLLQLAQQPFTITFLLIWIIIVALITILDGLMPVWGTKKFGGTPYGILGCIVGLVIGMFFFPPIGFVTGPLFGAFIGELIAGKTSGIALKAALGSFFGFMVGTGIKVVTAGIMAYYYLVNISL